MNITIIGGAGFIGTNLAIALSQKSNHRVTVIDRTCRLSLLLDLFYRHNIICRPYSYTLESNFDAQVADQDIVFHLASTTIPGNSNHNIASEIEDNVVVTIKLLDACIRQKVNRVVFLSSGGAVYGNQVSGAIKEDTITYPITSYGIQKVTIEKLLYLYYHQYGLDYKIVRLANPYGPYQRPNGQQGVVTTFIYKALTNDTLEVYGNGSVVRDFIYISDAIKGIINISNNHGNFRVFNLGSGKGTSIKEIIDVIEKTIDNRLNVIHKAGRKTDVITNYLDISRYEEEFGKSDFTCLSDGVKRTAVFLIKKYNIRITPKTLEIIQNEVPAF